MSTNRIISDAGNKFFPRTLENPSEVEQVLLEIRWTDKLQRLIEFGNNKYLKNFKLRLRMDADDDIQSLGEEDNNNVR